MPLSIPPSPTPAAPSPRAQSLSAFLGARACGELWGPALWARKKGWAGVRSAGIGSPGADTLQSPGSQPRLGPRGLSELQTPCPQALGGVCSSHRPSHSRGGSPSPGPGHPADPALTRRVLTRLLGSPQIGPGGRFGVLFPCSPPQAS